jgi:hypothetical protein
MSNSDELSKVNSGSLSNRLSSFNDISKSENFNSILNRHKSSGGSNSQTTRHVSGTNSVFISTLTHSKITFSKEHIIGEVKVIFLIPSIELFDKEFLIFFVNLESLKPITSGFLIKSESKISSI